MFGFCFRWLYDLLSRVIYQAKAFIKNASEKREEVGKKMRVILIRLKSIEKQQEEVIKDLHEYLNNSVDSAVEELSTYLSSEEVQARFTEWTLDEVPKGECSWEVTRNKILDTQVSRLCEFIEQWEKENQVFANTRESLVQHFKQRYNLVEEQLRNLQSAVTADNSVDDQSECDPEVSFTMAEKVIIGVTSPIWFPLGLVALVVGTPVVGFMAIKSNVEDKWKLKSYEEDKCNFMAEDSVYFLNTVITERLLKSFVNIQMEEANLCLKQIEARIPELIQADKKLYEQLVDETHLQGQLKDLYRPIMIEGSFLRSRLALFGLQEVNTVGINRDELEWKEDTSSCLRCGVSAAVYHGTMRRHGVDQPVHVAVKVYKEGLNVQNAAEILAEVDFLR